MAGEAGSAAVRPQGLSCALTSFVGRAPAVAKVAGLLERYRLVTVTGPGGVGKTRLADAVVRQVAGRYADGVRVVELAAVQEAALVPAAVATALGLQQVAGTSLTDTIAARLSGQQLLLVLDNCEHLLDAAAGFCARLLTAADDIRVLATSREPLGLPEEARYRLAPLDAGSEAVTLFLERARQVDPDLDAGGDAGQLIGQLVRRLDGMPLAIELAAARVEALGLAQLLELLDDRLRLLVSPNRAVADRQRSLEATVDWSYRLLTQAEQHVFRFLAVLPGPFTLEAAEAVAGTGATLAVLRLVDCSLLTPPRAGPDGRSRYAMLESLRDYGLRLLAASAEDEAAAAALAAYALSVAERAAAGLTDPERERQAAHWLDAEDAALHQALAWGLDHDPLTALRTAAALAPWWVLRGRWAEGYALLRRAIAGTGPEVSGWYAAHVWVYELSLATSDYQALADQASTVIDALRPAPPSGDLVDALMCRSGALRNLGRLEPAQADADLALRLSRQIGYATGEAFALLLRSAAAQYAARADEALRWAQQAQRVDLRGMTARRARVVRFYLPWALMFSGELEEARRRFEELLAQTREAGDQGLQSDILESLAGLARRTGQLPQAAAWLRESAQIAVAAGYPMRLIGLLHEAGLQCAAAGRPAESVTLWAARTTQHTLTGLAETAEEAQYWQAPLRDARKVLGPQRFAAAEKRGAAMTLAAATEFALLATGGETPLAAEPAPPRAGGSLSPRERELVALVAQGLTDAEIAGKLFITVATVRTYLDRIRDKSGCRRRADLTRLALREGIV